MDIQEYKHSRFIGERTRNLCRTSAHVVASNFKEFYFHNAHQNGAPGYYPHFHPWEGANHPHIWYIN